VNPVKRIVDAAHAVGAVVLVDGAQGAVHAKVDVEALGADFYAFSGHKMCGPTGIGALWARRELLEAMSPYHGGGEMIHIVGRDESTWADLPHKFEAGTPNIAGRHRVRGCRGLPVRHRNRVHRRARAKPLATRSNGSKDSTE
jgi:cysteine desulfurase / selenocysteine lyase